MTKTVRVGVIGAGYWGPNIVRNLLDAPGAEAAAVADLSPERLDALVLSHGHYDHYDIEAFQTYPDKSVPIVVKRGIAETARKAGFTSLVELDPWETATLGQLTITAAPASHGVPEVLFVHSEASLLP